jgi:hypothetical protein
MPDHAGGPVTDNPLAVLGRIRQAPSREASARRAPRPGERCELCGEEIGDEHGHLVDTQARNLLCACRGCYLLFVSDGAGGGHYRAVPDRYLAFPDLRFSAGQWDAMQIPVSVAFLFFNSSLGRMAAFYPSPAGATESELPLGTWAEVVGANPGLSALEPDVEAFLLRSRPGQAGAECYLVPIDVCYELVGHLRLLWRGFDGGREAHDRIGSFFARVQARCGANGR